MRARLSRFAPALLAALLIVPAIAPALETHSALIDALIRGDRTAALELSTDPNMVAASTADGTNALHLAARAGDGELVAALLEHGAAVDAANRYGITALHLAAENADATMLRALLDAGANANAALPEGETPLMLAARTGAPESLRVLLEHGADTTARESWYGETAMIAAAANNYGDAIAVLAAHGADVNARSDRQEFESRRLSQMVLPLGAWTPLMYAARENALDAGAALLTNGADPDLSDPDGATALVIAIINAHYEFAAMLIAGGADTNRVDESGMGALYAAVDMHTLAVGHGRPNPLPVGELDSVDIVRRLLAAGADANAQLSSTIMQRQHTFGDFTLGEGATPLLRAAKSGDIQMVRALLEGGADPMHTMPDSTNALMYAAGLGWRNGSPLAPSFDQGTEADAIETLALLLSLGLRIDATDAAGNTALHAAMGGRRSEAIIRYLIDEAGADIAALNANGQSPLERARPPVAETIVELFSAP